MQTPSLSKVPRRQAGFILVTSIIFISVLSVLVLLAMRKSMQDERISGYEQDLFIAREAAEMALRDAERDIAGQRFDGAYCSIVGKASCGNNLRPVGSRPANAVDSGNFWTVANTQNIDYVIPVATTDSRPSSLDNTNLGVYGNDAITACGKPLWQASDWDNNNPTAASETCSGGAVVRTVVYGTFTGAPNNFGAGVRLPRYLIESFDGQDLGISNSNKIFFRITAVGYGRTTRDDGTFTSVTLQSVFSAL